MKKLSQEFDLGLHWKLNERGWPVICSKEEYISRGRLPRHVADVDVLGCRVSTVFIGREFSVYFMRGSVAPLLFETMIFGNGESKWGRYAYWSQAWIGHQYAVEYVLSKRLLEAPPRLRLERRLDRLSCLSWQAHLCL